MFEDTAAMQVTVEDLIERARKDCEKPTIWILSPAQYAAMKKAVAAREVYRLDTSETPNLNDS